MPRKQLAKRGTPRPYERLETEIGGRGVMLEALLASGDERALRLYDYLTDKNSHYHIKPPSLSRACLDLRVSLHELKDIIVRLRHAESEVVMAEHLPDLARDLCQDARTQEYACPSCQGKNKTCPECHGLGKVRVRGNSDDREYILEAMGMRGKRGPLMAVQFNTGAVPSMAEVALEAERVLEGETVETGDSKG